MEYRRLGRTGLRVSVMGIGTGGPSRLGQSSGVPEAEAGQMVRRALDLGVNLIDTAADYGESESILGRALTGVARESYVLCTKFNGVRNHRLPALGPETLKAEAELEHSLERSLQRLGTDYVDVLQLHGLTPDWYAPVRDRFVPGLRRLQERGRLRFIGVTERFADDPHEHTAARLALQDDFFDTMMVGYNLLLPAAEQRLFPETQRRDIGVLAMIVVSATIAQPEQLAAQIAALKAAGQLAHDAGPDQGPLDWLVHGDVDSVTSAAYRFAAGHPAVSCVLSGTSRVAHLEQNVGAVLRGPLPEADRARLRHLFGAPPAEGRH
jgi:L-galactose dehydrogenase